MTIVFLVEEKSMATLLDVILPKILPPEISFRTIPHEGKSNLQDSIPKKIRAWNMPDTKFVVVHDQDSSDCKILKQKISDLCDGYGKPYLVRIACHELEAWYFGDLKAVEKAYNVNLDKYMRKSTYRIPDSIENPKYELRKMVPKHQQISGARKIGEFMDIANNTSVSFQMFVSGVKSLL